MTNLVTVTNSNSTAALNAPSNSNIAQKVIAVKEVVNISTTNATEIANQEGKPNPINIVGFLLKYANRDHLLYIIGGVCTLFWIVNTLTNELFSFFSSMRSINRVFDDCSNGNRSNVSRAKC